MAEGWNEPQDTQDTTENETARTTVKTKGRDAGKSYDQIMAEKIDRRQLKVECLKLAQNMYRSIPDTKTEDIVTRAKAYYDFAR